MFQGKSILAIIPARGGSKGVLRKNTRKIAGKPLIAWTIEEAKKSKYIDRLILSSEDEEIISVAKNCGCEVPFVRPQGLARDDTLCVEVVLNALQQLPPYDYIVLLQPTSPLRKAFDIDACIVKCIKRHACSCVSVTEMEKSPYWMYMLREDHSLTPLLRDSIKNNSRRQDLPNVFALNGAVYVVEVNWFMETNLLLCDGTLAHVMPKERSLDIDTELDIKMVKTLLFEDKNAKA